jgi:predicted RNase H-like HicB family nuclease
MRYAVVVVSDEPGTGFVADMPAVHGCFTFGDDLLEALAMAQVAAAMLARMAAQSEEIPTELPGPSSPPWR